MTAMTLSAAAISQIEKELEKYPADRRQSAVMAALRIVQEEFRWVSKDIMQEIADLLGIPAIHVYEIATFYSMYEHGDVGVHKICVCTNISCKLRGSKEILDYLKEKTGIGPGETTADGRICIKEVECLGACGGAPMMQVNKEYHENLTPDSIDSILEGLD
ncbi:NADH-quinone oxidoreductase subunit 2 [bacterium BMS3Bbin11]|nr:NADH-quinone oxidoreductase subunit 2 [bacterium BMS3Abin11]GBE46270.1 NADH-quinone oxidoreductase subunit 2 [bacterium BMS3Bbin11]